MDTWSDDNFDYFRNSDGQVVRVRRDFSREMAEAQAAQLRRKVLRANEMARAIVVLFVMAASLWLAVLIVFELLGGAG